ncbi:MAG: tRNA (5-methylaminomethyl-2-thiouridine)(34)-methyltransferase MnmD [Rhodobacteraceae bacterium]|nr:tRNA (5-methylaminomethyl-2-thiouridine)(34)-methyltransferase MnmD [Paracoccaceae bacterium]
MAEIEHPTANVTWRDGDVPVSTRFDDPYYSLENGLAETEHTFLSGNDLPARFRDGFHVAELGFGTGLNFLATVRAWREAGTPGTLHYTSFELYPMDPSDAERALDAFPGLFEKDLAPMWEGELSLPWLEARVVTGDARKTLPAWSQKADAWFLDGFSPAKNPELWEPALMAAVGAHTAPGGTCATYSAAGAIRRSLEDASFSVERVPGYGRKRHMTRGQR